MDQAAWEEPVYEEQPVYETYGVNICNICGAELLTSEEISRHGEQYVDWETMSSPFSYHYEERKRQTGTETVQTGTVRHEEKGHYEARLSAELPVRKRYPQGRRSACPPGGVTACAVS